MNEMKVSKSTCTCAKNHPKNDAHPYLDTIFKVSEKYLQKTLSVENLEVLKRESYSNIRGGKRETIKQFIDIYYILAKSIYQQKYKGIDKSLATIIETQKNRPKLMWGGCLNFLRLMNSESVQLMITSPPYYNAREYTQWKNLDDYLTEMEEIIAECYRVLDNHRPFVFNIGDIFDNDFRHTRSSWGKRRIPLGAYFTDMFERIGFQFVDDFIWDKGEPQSQRHKNGDNPYPLYQYPINCYEHIFVFYKHRLDDMLYPCPVCGCLKVNGNAYSGIGVKSWECKNLDCTERSLGNRGKRFSARSHTMTNLKCNENEIIDEQLRAWRRDIVKIQPVIKINNKGENTLGHTAPFPGEIPRYAISVFSGRGETVLDPFAGSFTSVREGINLGRNSLGMEVNRSMFRESVVQRFREFNPMELKGTDAK